MTRCTYCGREITKCICKLVEPVPCTSNELDRLAKLNAELREFAQHKSACRSWPYSVVPDSLKICDCGLAQLLEKLDPHETPE